MGQRSVRAPAGSLRPHRIFGLLTRQESPTLGLRKYGVSPGGPLDRESLRLANALVGNPEWQPAWELLGTGEFEATKVCTVAIVGGLGHPTNGCWKVREGERLTVHSGRTGSCLYIAVGSGPERRLADPPSSLAEGPIRVLAGPQAAYFDLDGFITSDYRVTTDKDRVGVRLIGLAQEHGIELPSEPACVGAVQLTNNGMPVILGPDGPTIGGYPKIAVVIDADLDRVGQVVPGQSVRFELLTLDEARAEAKERERLLLQRLLEITLA